MKTLEERLLEKIAVRGPDDCWEWRASTDRNGYGQISGSGVTLKSHRVAWVAANGPIPDGLFVCHRCDNPPCCNPAHLFLGNNADNHADMVRKGRSSWKPQTHCIHGHEFIPENTYVLPDGERCCRECGRVRSRVWRAHKRAVKLAAVPVAIVLAVAVAGSAAAHTPSHSASCQAGVTAAGTNYQGGTIALHIGTASVSHRFTTSFSYALANPDKTIVEHWSVDITTDDAGFDAHYEGTVPACQTTTTSSSAATTTSRPPTSSTSSTPTPPTTVASTTQPSTTSTTASTPVPSTSSAATSTTPSSSVLLSSPSDSSSGTPSTPPPNVASSTSVISQPVVAVGEPPVPTKVAVEAPSAPKGATLPATGNRPLDVALIAGGLLVSGLSFRFLARRPRNAR